MAKKSHNNAIQMPLYVSVSWVSSAQVLRNRVCPQRSDPQKRLLRWPVASHLITLPTGHLVAWVWV